MSDDELTETVARALEEGGAELPYTLAILVASALHDRYHLTASALAETIAAERTERTLVELRDLERRRVGRTVGALGRRSVR